MRFLLLIAGLALAFAITVTRSGRAEERRVVVLIPQRLPGEPWPEATQAVIAELAAGDYQVLVASSRAVSLEALLAELSSAIESPSTAGAVAIVRQGSTGVAYVRTRRDADVLRLEAEATAGAVAEGRLALGVTELLRTRDLDLPEPPATPEKPAPPPPRPRPAPVAPLPDAPSSKPLVWIGPGLLFTSDGPRPLASLDLGAQVPLFRALAAEAGVALSIVPLELDTGPGRVSLSARQATGHLVLEALSSRSASLAFGLGGGALWLEQSAESERPGLEGRSNSTTVAVISASARGALHTKRVSFVLSVQPGAMLPPVSVEAEQQELAELGRPWIVVATGIGWNL